MKLDPLSETDALHAVQYEHEWHTFGKFDIVVILSLLVAVAGCCCVWRYGRRLFSRPKEYKKRE